MRARPCCAATVYVLNPRNQDGFDLAVIEGMHDDNPTSRQLWEMVDSFRYGMLITRQTDGAPRPRPMTLVDRDDGELRFVTSRDSDLVEEIERDGGVALALQSPGRYVALRGVAALDDDIGKIREVWSELMRPWFPNGPNDSRIILVRFSAIEAEYWNLSGLSMARFFLRAATAYAKGEPIEPAVNDERMHADVVV